MPLSSCPCDDVLLFRCSRMAPSLLEFSVSPKISGNVLSDDGFVWDIVRGNVVCGPRLASALQLPSGTWVPLRSLWRQVAQSEHVQVLSDVRQVLFGDDPLLSLSWKMSSGQHFSAAGAVVDYDDHRRPAVIIGSAHVMTTSTDGTCSLDADCRSACQQMSRSVNALLINMIAHEIRSPLAAVFGAIDVIESLQNVAAVHDYLRVIRESAAVISDTIDNVIVFGKIRSGQWVQQPVNVDITDVCSAVRHAVLRTTSHATITLTYSQDVPKYCAVDPTLLFYLLLNPMANAVKYAGPTGNVTVSVGYARARFKIIVSDDGPGISPNDMKRMFRPYVRGEYSAHLAPRGLGLGMSIAQLCACMLGGTIRVRSAKGQGTSCFISVPVISSSALLPIPGLPLISDVAGMSFLKNNIDLTPPATGISQKKADVSTK